MAGTTHYYYQFQDELENIWRVDIRDSTYYGDTFTQVYPDETGLVLKWQGPSDSSYQAIIPSEATLNLIIDDNSRDLIDSIIAGKERQFIVIFYRVLINPIDWNDFDSYEREWSGPIMRNQIVVPDAANGIDFIEITAVDGLGLLDDIIYDGTQHGTIGSGAPEFDINDLTNWRLTEWIWACLYQTGIYDAVPGDVPSGSKMFSTALVWYEDNHPHTSADDPFHNTRVNQSAFVEVDHYGRAVGKSMRYILESILNTLNASIRQWHGSFLIIQDNIYTQSQTRVWHYDANNLEPTTELLDLQATMPTRGSGGIYNHVLPVNKVTTNYAYRSAIYGNNLLPSYIDDGVNYNFGTSDPFTQLRLRGRILINYYGDPSVTSDICLVFKLKIKVGDFYLQTDAYNTPSWTTNSAAYARIVSVPFNGANDTTVVADFNWLTPEFIDDTILVPIQDTETGKKYKISALGGGDWTLIGASATPTVGEIFTRNSTTYSGAASGQATEYAASGGYIMSMQYDLLQWELWAIPTTGIPYIPVGSQLASFMNEPFSWIFQAYSDTPMSSMELHTATVNNNATANIELTDSVLGEGIFGYLCGQLSVYNGANWVNSNLWTIYSEIGGTAYKINSLRCREMIALRRNTLQFYSGNFFGVPDVWTGFTFKGYNWSWKTITWDVNSARFSGEAMRINLSRSSITINTPIVASDENSSSSGSSGSIVPVANSHNRLHDVTNSLDHAPATGSNKGKVLGSNASTGALEWQDGSGLWQRVDSGGGIYVLSPTTANDSVYAASDTGVAVNGVANTQVGVQGDTVSGVGVNALASGSGVGIHAQSASGNHAEFGDGTNQTVIEKDGTLRFDGTATVYDDIRVSLANVKAPAADPPTWVAYKGSEVPAFAATKTEVLYFVCQLPHSYKEGSDIEFHFHAVYPNANSGNSRWKFTYSWANINGTFPTETSVLQTFASAGTTDKHVIHSFGTLTGTSKTISSVLLCSISRLGADGVDTYASPIRAVSADFHFQIDTIGSRSTTGK